LICSKVQIKRYNRRISENQSGVLQHGGEFVKEFALMLPIYVKI
jgi:hypothetical protein